MNRKGAAIGVMLIIAVVAFFFIVVLDRFIDKTKFDPLISEKQAEVISVSEKVLGNRIRVFNAKLREHVWNAFNDPNQIETICAFYGRSLFGECTGYNEGSFLFEGANAKYVSSFEGDNFVVVGSSGKLVKENVLIPARQGVYNLSIAGFVDAKSTLSFPGLQDILSKMKDAAKNCATTICLENDENEFWFGKVVSPFTGLSIKDAFKLHIVEQIQKCASATNVPCSCAFEYPSAKVLGVEGDEYNKEVLSSKMSFDFSKGVKATILGEEVALPVDAIEVRDVQDKRVSMLEGSPTTNFFFEWEAIDGSKGGFEPAAKVVVKEKRLVLVPKEKAVSEPACTFDERMHVVELTSKKLYPPNAQPLTLYYGVQVVDLTHLQVIS